MFVTASLLSFKNYWRTRGLTNYWLFIAVTALFGAAWTGNIIIGDVFGVTAIWLQDSQLALIASSLVGYTASLMKASAVDVIAEIV